MSDQASQIRAYKKANPHATLLVLSKLFHVPSSTISDRLKSTHQPADSGVHRTLSAEQELSIVDKANRFATSGTKLEPRHIQELGEMLAGKKLGSHWASRFLGRHKDSLTADYFRYQEAPRVKADTQANRDRFYDKASFEAKQ